MIELKKIPTWLPVVAAAITREDGCLLMRQRPAGKHHGGLWEFPGGKVEAHETPAFALVREVEEELGLLLDPAALSPAAFAESTAGDAAAPIVILLYRAAGWRGEPVAREGGDWGWFSTREVARLAKPPLDVDLFGQLVARS